MLTYIDTKNDLEHVSPASTGLGSSPGNLAVKFQGSFFFGMLPLVVTVGNEGLVWNPIA